MRFSLGLLFLVAVCGAYETPTNLEQTSLIRHKRDLVIDIIEKIMIEIFEQLPKVIECFMQVAKETYKVVLYIIQIFSHKNRPQPVAMGMSAMTPSISQTLADDAKSLLQYVYALESTVLQCLHSHRHEIMEMARDILKTYLSCVMNTTPEERDTIYTLYSLTDRAVILLIKAYGELKNCTKDVNHIVKLSMCLGKAAYHIESKGRVLLKDSLQLVHQGDHLIKALTTLRKNVVVCASSGFSSAESEAASVVWKVMECTTNSEDDSPNNKDTNSTTEL